MHTIFYAKNNCKFKTKNNLHKPKKGMIKNMILIIGEKPSVARAISHAVGANESKDGYNVGNDFVVSWCLGHLVGLALPDEYNNGWDKQWNFSQLPMIPESWQFKISQGTKKQFEILKKLMSNERVTAIICATDADREGECIFRYVYKMTECQKPVMRLWVSSLEESAINKALNEMKPMSEYDNLFKAGFSRAKADWLVGMNFSRLFSCRYGETMNIGRVQSPTLAMIVRRDKEISGFQKKKFFTCDIDCGSFVLSSDRIDEEEKADDLVKACESSQVRIISVTRETRTEKAPLLYDLTTLQKDANRIFGYTAQQTLDYTQSLYEGKLCTYPRTDSNFLPDDMAETVKEITRIIDHCLGFDLSHTPNISAVIDNNKVTGHHAIIPTRIIAEKDISSLPEGERNIFSLIAQRLVCACADEFRYESVKITGECKGEKFYAKGKTVVQTGWKKYLKFKAEEKKEETLPEIAERETFDGKSEKTVHFTSPPKSYTEGTLLSAMENAGLGTPATRASIIESLVKNGYAERKQKSIKAVEKGVKLIESLPDDIRSEKLTSEWEMKLKHIENGEFSDNEFMNEIGKFITQMCEKYSEKVVAENAVGKCPECNGDVIKGKYGFYCKDKCGMTIGKVYGITLDEQQVKSLLSGNPCYYSYKGKRIKILPETEEITYNGRTLKRWKTTKE